MVLQDGRSTLLALRFHTCYDQVMAKHITRIDDVEDEVVRAIVNLSLRKIFSGDEVELVKSFDNHIDKQSKAIPSLKDRQPN